ncbi:MAG: redoxin domain-containing protein [Blastocatellia bacterium]
MKSRNILSLFAGCALVLALLTATTRAQEQPKPAADPELERVKKLTQDAWEEAQQFLKGGNKESDAAYPGRKWAVTLWEYGAEHPGTPAAAHATGEALHFLAHAGLHDELAAKADSLKADDPAWRRLVSVLLESAERSKDYAYAIRKLTWLTQNTADKKLQARAQFSLGQAWWKKGDNDLAKAAFRQLIADQPGSASAKEAEGNLFEMESLNVGQPAPQFAFKGANGAPVSLAGYKGKVVLLNFWASWCGICAKEFPLLKELAANRQDQGLVIIGVSFDEEEQPFQDAIKKHGLTWPQIRDGKERAIARLFNVQEQPAHYILDREGRIAAKLPPFEKVSGIIADLLKTKPAAESGEHAHEHKHDEVARQMNLRAGDVVADIGAGDGVFTRRFAVAVGPAGKAIGIDIDPGAVRKMTADARRLNLSNYEARLVPADDPMLAPNSVDVIFLSDTYHHINDRVNYFARARQTLKPGGRLVIVDSVKARSNDTHSVVKEEVLDELRRAGYRLVKESELLAPRQYFFTFEPDSAPPSAKQ